MAVTTYNPKSIIITCGSHIVTGYADDTFLSIEPEGDGITAVSGCDGEVARAIDPNDLCTISLTLLQSSESNTYFGNQFKMDKLGQDGSFGIVIEDELSKKSIFVGTGWVTKMATITRGKDLNNVEWSITAAMTTYNV